MTQSRHVDRLSLPVMLVAAVTLLAFLPLALPDLGGVPPQPVESYTTGMHGVR